MGVANPCRPRTIYGRRRYLAWLLEKQWQQFTLATAAYNAGPGAVERYNGIPPYEETQTYVVRVKISTTAIRKRWLPLLPVIPRVFPTGADMPL